MAIKVECWGDYALFTRPELKTERVSYDMITPSAARGLIEAIYWHPGLKWVIDRIHVCAPYGMSAEDASDLEPFRFMNLRRNEVKSVISANVARTAMNRGNAEGLYLNASADIQQRASLLLRDVHYVIEAHFEMTDQAAPGDNPGKFQDIAKRRIRSGQFYHQPCFGCREFPANFCLCEEIPPCPPKLRGECRLGYMLWDIDYSDRENLRPLFFNAVLHDGVLNVPTRDSGEVRG